MNGLPYLPNRPVDLMTVDSTWAAVAVPSDWGRHVLDVLGDESGPVFHDPVMRTLVWPLPAGGAGDWPTATGAGVERSAGGDLILVPAAGGYHEGTRWLRPPALKRPFTDPNLLRAALEFVIGPLADAGALGPIAVCEHCRAVIRHAVRTGSVAGLSGGGHSTYACRRCWTSTVRGGDGRHLRAVVEGVRE